MSVWEDLGVEEGWWVLGGWEQRANRTGLRKEGRQARYTLEIGCGRVKRRTHFATLPSQSIMAADWLSLAPLRSGTAAAQCSTLQRSANRQRVASRRRAA